MKKKLASDTSSLKFCLWLLKANKKNKKINKNQNKQTNKDENNVRFISIIHLSLRPGPRNAEPREIFLCKGKLN